MLGLIVDFASHAAGGQERARLPCRAPVVVLADVTPLVDIVCIGQQREAHTVGESKQEAAGQPPLLCSSCRFHIPDISLAVLVLEVDVHHVAARLDVVAQRHAFVGLLLVNFQVLDGIIGQVLQEHFLVAAEEGAGAQQQFVHLASVDEDLAIGIHRHTFQLTDEVVEHRAFGEFEGRGIIDERVAAPEHLDLRGCDGQFAHGLCR